MAPDEEHNDKCFQDIEKGNQNSSVFPLWFSRMKVMNTSGNQVPGKGLNRKPTLVPIMNGIHSHQDQDEGLSLRTTDNALKENEGNAKRLDNHLILGKSLLEVHDGEQGSSATPAHIQQLLAFFDSLHADNDGQVTKKEICEALMKSAAINRIHLSPGVVQDCVDKMMRQADLDSNGILEFEEFVALLYELKKKRELPHLDFIPADLRIDHHSLSQRTDPAKGFPERPSTAQCIKGLMFSKIFQREAMFYAANNWKQALTLFVWVGACASVFQWQYIEHRMYDPLYKLGGPWLSLSKGSSEVVKFNTAILLFLVCRRTLTRLRETALCRFIPFDDRLDFHKLTAGAIILFAFIHTMGFICGTFRLISVSPPAYYSSVLDLEVGTQSPSYAQQARGFNAVSGYILWLILIVLSLMALKSVRNYFGKRVPLPKLARFLSGFGAFWWSHMLLFPFYFLIIFFHGSKKSFPDFPTTTTWKYFIGPLVLYAIERLHKLIFSRTTGQLHVVKAEILPGKVLALHFSHPPFEYRSGTYVFIQVPTVSRFEWHPFSITSACSDQTLSVHIRAVGDWTDAVFELWKTELVKQEEFYKMQGKDPENPCAKGYAFPKVLVNGPFGAPAQDYENYKVIMLVGAGIGVTPFASVLRDVLYKSKNQAKFPLFKVEKVLFYWTTREQESFKWFSELMERLALEDDKGIIEMNNYLTSAYGDDDPKAFLLKTVQALYHEQEGIDIISGTKAKITTHTARPDWDVVFSGISKRIPKTTVGVFYCGPPVLQSELKKQCRIHTVQFDHGTSFVFKKENF